MPDPWSPERIGFLMQLWAGGATAQVIAARLGGLSRSAVLGKIYRLRRAGELLAPAKMRPAHRARQTEPLPPPPASEPQGLLDLTNNSCRWPISGPGRCETVYCGAPEADLAGGMPYCAYHARRAYVIPPKRVAAAKTRVAAAERQSEAVPRSRRRYVWRAPVRHPAPRGR